MPTTPMLVIDEQVMRANVAAAAGRARSHEISLRPHVKTHKCLEIARIQRAVGATAITVATIGEAEVFVADGWADVLVAYPLWIDDLAAARLRRLAESARLLIGVDSVEAAIRAAALAGSVGVLVEVDAGFHRTGCPPEDAGRVGAAAAGVGLEVGGAFTFPGHAYSTDARMLAALDESRALARARDSLAAAGLTPAVLSGGTTPSVEFTDTTVVSETRPGVYVFNDAQQWELGVCGPEEIALTAHATAVSHAGGRLVLDAGSKAIGADRPAYVSGHGRLLDHPEARILHLSEHHAVVQMPGPLPPLGSTVRVVPNHVCTAVNLADWLWTSEGDRWRVAARGQNT